MLLQKPRRNWWASPGGKMELGENIREAAVREYKEETDIQVKNPELKAVSTIVIQEGDEVVSEWMMFTFYGSEFEGKNPDTCPEGILKWHKKDEVSKLAMAPGDHYLVDHLMNGTGMMYCTFYYSPDFKLISYRLETDKGVVENS